MKKKKITHVRVKLTIKEAVAVHRAILNSINEDYDAKALFPDGRELAAAQRACLKIGKARNAYWRIQEYYKTGVWRY